MLGTQGLWDPTVCSCYVNKAGEDGKGEGSLFGPASGCKGSILQVEPLSSLKVTTKLHFRAVAPWEGMEV